MNKSFKMKYLPLFALIMGGSLAVATKPADRTRNVLAVQWQRVAPDGTSAGTWQQSSSGACLESDKICKAEFADGYDPRTHTEEQNDSAAISGTVELGYVPQ